MIRAESRVQLLGYFGWGNFGDDLFREVVQERAGMIWPQARVRAFEGDRQNFSHPRADAALRRIGTTAKGSLWATTFAYCGGSVFSELRGAAAFRLRMRRRQFEALGISVGPFGSAEDQDAVVTALSRFRRVVVRDQESLQRLNGGAVLGGDLAALSTRVPALPRNEGATGARSGGIVVCPSRAAPESAADAAAQVASALRADDGRVTVLALNAHPQLGDRGKAEAIVHRLRAAGHSAELLEYGRLGIGGVFEVLGNARVVFSQRLHGAIVAYLLGTPVAIVDHHEKCRAFARDIGLDPRFLVREFGELAPLVQAVPGSDECSALPWTLPVTGYIRRAEAAYLSGSL